MKIVLLLCMAKADEIFNAATEKSCEQTVMDDEMKYCADRKYSLRTGLDLSMLHAKRLTNINYNRDCVIWVGDKLEERCDHLYSNIILSSANWPIWRTWNSINYR